MKSKTKEITQVIEKPETRKVILSIENLKKYFVNQGYINKAVDGVSFNLHEGEIIGLIGESGSGKTTVGRSILRLYDDYNGFIRLNEKIISGKKLTRQRTKYLRRNVQMIFQDPHASLNGQHTIYSILREPLIINGILKEKLDDIFLDWQDVKKAFKYTFHINAMQLEVQNYREINRLAKPFFAKWEEEFANFKFSDDDSFEDSFSRFFLYLEEKQLMESKIINNVYTNTNKLFNIYYEHQQKYRNRELSSIETNYWENSKRLKKEIELTKISAEAYEAKKILLKLKQDYKNLKLEKIEQLRTCKNTFINFLNEYKNESEISQIEKLMTLDLKSYIFNLKSQLLFLKKYSVLKEISKKCKYLQFEEARKVIADLDSYADAFFAKYLKEINFHLVQTENIGENSPQLTDEQIKSLDLKLSKPHIEIKKILNEDFEFDFSSYVVLSQKSEEEFDKKIANLEHEILKTKQIIKDGKKKNYSTENLKQAQNALKEAEQTYIEDMNLFLKSYRVKITKAYEQLQEQKQLYLNLRSSQQKCNTKFDEIEKMFWSYLESKITDEKSFKEINALISYYKSDIAVKKDTLKSFQIEKYYLDKDLKNLYILLGIDLKWAAKNIADENVVWKDRFNKYNSNFFKPLAKFYIGQLLCKTIIYKSLEDVGLLKQFAYRYPHEFSGGQLQRIVIARALITQPKIIVADEPIASLDISIQAQVINLLKELCNEKNIGMILIAHDLSMIEYVADNVQIMHLGKIVEFGKTENIYARPIHPYTINLFKAIPKISNSNEKFENISFELDYLEEQKYPNVLEIFNVDTEHYVLGTREQIKKWFK
ncbi:ATP-binding cassette domain-containing protein [Metamycoplasma hyosynoviae]|uniref:Oligopeptide transport system ATP-binding protein n=1 Tax=Metamycoplasma hyosynoviae TaxID=29559 RepID=A0A4R7U099_9BACT|nr:ATP-binding cassette domain-containing protein [Metamycoplasma hyosynoviae]TDU98038.1 oligopeptide transport system ATP-binding protein [Metamycoplasma hyosynoviae]